MINDMAHARSYAHSLKRIVKPAGIGHLAAHDMAARTLGARDWRTLMAEAQKGKVHADRGEVEQHLRTELAPLDGIDVDDAIVTLLPPEVSAKDAIPDLVDSIPEPLALYLRTDPTPDTMVATPDAQTWDTRWRDPMKAFTARQLACIARSLLMEPHSPLGGVHERIERTMEKGWFMRYDVEDILHDWDMRSAKHRLGMPVDTLMRGLGIEWTQVMYRPTSRSDSCMVHQGLEPATFAGLCIVMEQLGFRTPAAEMVDRTIGGLKKRTILTEEELRVHWYLKEAGKTQRVYMAPDASDPEGYQEGTLPDGHKYEFTTCGNGVSHIQIKGPRYRRPRR